MKTTQIVLADDHRLVAESLRALLEKEPGLTIVGEAANGRETLALVHRLQPDMVLMDASMPDLNGIEATRRLRATQPRVAVLCLSMHAAPRYVEAMLEAGAAGYVLKDCASEELLRAIRVVMAGQVYLSPTISGAVVEALRSRVPAAAAPREHALTVRERETLQLLAEGCSTQQIGERLKLSVKTVATHREHLMAKLDIHSVAGLTRYAIQEGLSGIEVRTTN